MPIAARPPPRRCSSASLANLRPAQWDPECSRRSANASRLSPVLRSRPSNASPFASGRARSPSRPPGNGLTSSAISPVNRTSRTSLSLRAAMRSRRRASFRGASGRSHFARVSCRARHRLCSLELHRLKDQLRMLAKTPVTIVTGFLGAGKTTLIRHLMANANGRRLAFIINEFGDVGVDGDLVRSCSDAACPEDAIIELANGCICCTVADDFVPAITALLAREPKPDHIIVETSGLALPKPLIKAFDWPDLRTRLTVDGVVAVVDAAAVAEGRFADDPARVAAQRLADPSLDHDNPLEEVYEDQLMSADLVVLNKADLVDKGQLEALKAQIAAAVPRAVKIAPAREGAIDPEVLIGMNAAAENDLNARPSHHDAEGEHDHDDFDTFVVTIPAVGDPDTLIDRLAAATRAHDILRIKGFIDVAGKPLRMLVQGVGERFPRDFHRPWGVGEPRLSRLVVIAERGVDREAVALALGA